MTLSVMVALLSLVLLAVCIMFLFFCAYHYVSNKKAIESATEYNMMPPPESTYENAVPIPEPVYVNTAKQNLWIWIIIITITYKWIFNSQCIMNYHETNLSIHKNLSKRASQQTCQCAIVFSIIMFHLCDQCLIHINMLLVIHSTWNTMYMGQTFLLDTFDTGSSILGGVWLLLLSSMHAWPIIVCKGWSWISS